MGFVCFLELQWMLWWHDISSYPRLKSDFQSSTRPQIISVFVGIIVVNVVIIIMLKEWHKNNLWRVWAVKQLLADWAHSCNKKVWVKRSVFSTLMQFLSAEPSAVASHYGNDQIKTMTNDLSNTHSPMLVEQCVNTCTADLKMKTSWDICLHVPAVWLSSAQKTRGQHRHRH